MAETTAETQAAAQNAFDIASKSVQVKLLAAQGVTVPAGTGITAVTNNGITVITTQDGHSIRVPQDDYEALITSTQLDAQASVNQEAAYQEWAAIHTTSGPINSVASQNAFLVADAIDRNNGGQGFYVDPRLGSAAYARGQRALTNLSPQLQNLPTEFKPAALDVLQPSNALVRPLIPAQTAALNLGLAGALVIPAAVTPTTALVRPAAAANNSRVTPDPVSAAAATAIPDSPAATTTTTVGLGRAGGGGENASNLPGQGNPTPNPLNAYASYTYGLALHMLSESEFNGLVTNGSIVPKTTLIASAGRQANRAAGWTENFFFDEFKLTTIIGMNASTAGSNAIDMSFTIIEPMGLSLLDRLIKTTAAINAGNYLVAPYLMQIDFFNSSDGSQPDGAITSLRKWIPLRIIGCGIKVTQRGSEYRFTAVAYHHKALADSVLSTPANFEVTGSTLSDFFASDASATGSPGAAAADAAARQIQATKGLRDSNTADASGTTGGNATEFMKIPSYVQAYNQWQKDSAAKLPGDDKRIADGYNEISVVFHPDIINSDGGKIVDATTLSVKNVQMGNQENRVGASSHINTDVSLRRIRAGTQITQVIKSVMEKSEYVRRQIKNAQSNSTSTSTPLAWFKIIPSITLKKYLPVSNRWTFKVTYAVVTYRILNIKHPDAPIYKTGAKDAVKKYDYLYTGNNTEILDMNMDFDALFYTALTTNRTAGEATAGSQPKTIAEPKPNRGNKSRNNSLSPAIKNQQDDTAASSNQNRDDPLGQRIINISDSLYTKASKADLLTLQLKINGDPDYIKQEELVITPLKSIQDGSLANYSSNRENSGGSLSMDSGELVVLVRFKVPLDYDMNTGGLTDSFESGFSGVYRVISVDSVFKGGKFEQTLDMVRYPDQEGDTVGTDGRSDSLPAVTP